MKINMGKPKNNLNQRLEELKKEEKRLFDSYNRHAPANVKIGILSAKIKVIEEIEKIKLQIS